MQSSVVRLCREVRRNRKEGHSQTWKVSSLAECKRSTYKRDSNEMKFAQARRRDAHLSQLQTLVIGPVVGRETIPVLPTRLALIWERGFEMKGVMLWLTPSANTNCSRNSTFVRPLAGGFANKNKDSNQANVHKPCSN